MKKILSLIAMTTALTACEGVDMTPYMTASTSDPVRVRMRACMLSEAQSKMQAGTLLAGGFKAEVDNLSKTCVKKLALQSAGIDEEAASTATSVLNNLLGNNAK